MKQEEQIERLRVLVVDDETVVCESIRRVLADDYNVTTTCSAREGLEKIEREPFDLLLLDIRMPEIEGMEFLGRARSMSPRMQVLMITGYPTTKTAVEAIRQGAFDYLQKPVTPDQLLAATARALERKRLIDITHRLRQELDGRCHVGNIVCASAEMRQVMRLVESAASADDPVLITGETGTGKELVARAIHWSGRLKNGPFVTASCGAPTDSLLESELFGPVRSGLAGITGDRNGLFAAAHGSTLFLDEVANVSLRLQNLLLRAVNEREIRPVNAGFARQVAVRLIAATGQNLQKLVEAGSFREDLFHKLSASTIDIPPLRSRIEEIPLLAHHFIRRFSAQFNKKIEGITPGAMRSLETYHWPGNVRELEGTVEHAVLLCNSEFIDVDVLS